MLSTSRDVLRTDSQITAHNQIFDTVKEFVYLGSAVNTKNNVRLEIKCRITPAYRCYYGLNGQLSKKDLSRTTKLILNNTHMRGTEALTLLSTDEAALKVFERKVLIKISDPVRVRDNFRVRFNGERLLNGMNVV